MPYFIPRNNQECANSLTQFATEIPNYQAALGFTAAEVAEAVADAAFMQWTVKTEGIIEDYADSFKTFLHDARYNATNIALVPPPAPVLDAAPAAVKSGIQARFAQKAKKAKASINYTETIGKALGIVSSSTASRGTDTDTPDLKVTLVAGFPTLSFHLIGYEAVNIYKDDGTGYKLFKTAHRSPAKDTNLPAVGQTALYKYQAIYIDHDTEVATMSPEVSVAVVGR